jgi:hypothetical protein
MEEDEARRVVDFLLLAGQLKTQKRTGWCVPCGAALSLCDAFRPRSLRPR